MTGRLPLLKPDGKWTYTSVATAGKEAGFQTMDKYIWQHNNTVTQNISTQSLLDLCEGLERALGEQTGMCWWEQVNQQWRRWKMMGGKSYQWDVKEDSLDGGTKTSKSSGFN